MVAEELTPAAIDCILYNLKTWRRLVALMEPRTSTSVVRLPVATSRPLSSAVERVAVRRALVTEVLDAAERALKDLPPELRQIARFRYDHQMTYREIARLLTKRARRRVGADQKARVSTSTVHQKVESIRYICAQHLASVGPEFWGVLRTLELDSAEQKP